MDTNTCAYCGASEPRFVAQEGYCFCDQCYQRMDTCAMCIKGGECEFETNPSPLPKQIPYTVRQGNMMIQTVIPNPERVKLFCFPCGCFDEENLYCCKQDGYCTKYNEIQPSSRQDDET